MTSEKTTRIRWLLIFWLFVLSAVSYLDRVNISTAGGAIADAYHLTNLQLGNVFSALLAGYGLFQTVGGRLAERYGSRRVLAAGVVWWGVFTALTALVPPNILGALIAFMAVRFMLGAGEAVIYPSANLLVARWIPVSERGIANGWIFAGVGAGAGLTPPLVTYLMVHYGWRSSFWFCSVVGLVAGAVWFVIARDTPAEHPRISAAELQEIQRGISSSAPAATQATISWKRIVQSKEVLAITLSYFCYGYVAWIYFSWFFRYLATVRGLDLKASAFYSALPPLAMLAGCLIGGTLNDRLTRLISPRAGRCYLAAFAIAIAGIFIAFGSKVQDARLASVVLAGGAGALYLSQSSFWSVTADIGGQSAGSVSGLMNTGNQFGGFITASLTPWIAQQFGWSYAFLAGTALCLLGAVCWLVVDPTKTLFATTNSSVPGKIISSTPLQNSHASGART